MPLSVVVNRMDEGMSNLLLLSVPMFVFLGLLMEMTGIARVMVAFLAALVGHVRGGLSYVLLGAMYSGVRHFRLEGGRHGSGRAGAVPRDADARGSHPGELAALLASSSAMSETIPPSLVLITIGSVTNVSITALFTGGLLPAAVAALALVVGELVSLAPHGYQRRRARPAGADSAHVRHRGAGTDACRS